MRDMRSGPYVVVFSIVFAFILQNLATWLHGLDFSKPVVEMVLSLGLIGSFFIYSIYFWLFFSRVLIYFEEDGKGELLSFCLAASILTVILFLKEHVRYWPFFLLVPSFLVFLKIILLSKRTKLSSMPEFDDKVKSWKGWTGGISLALLVLGLVTIPGNSDEDIRQWIFAIVPLVLLVLGAAGVVRASQPIRIFIEDLVERDIENENKQSADEVIQDCAVAVAEENHAQ